MKTRSRNAWILSNMPESLVGSCNVYCSFRGKRRDISVLDIIDISDIGKIKDKIDWKTYAYTSIGCYLLIFTTIQRFRSYSAMLINHDYSRLIAINHGWPWLIRSCRMFNEIQNLKQLKARNSIDVTCNKCLWNLGQMSKTTCRTYSLSSQSDLFGLFYKCCLYIFPTLEKCCIVCC